MGEVYVPVKATPDQFDEITELWESSVKATHHFLTQEDIAYFKPLVRNTYLSMVDLYVVRAESERIIAFLGTVGDQVEMLFLDPALRRQGIGKHLMQFAIDSLGVTKVDVNEQNPEALAFYQHMGFKVISRSPFDPQGKPFPILHMSL